jgi:hypothetical protein
MESNKSFGFDLHLLLIVLRNFVLSKRKIVLKHPLNFLCSLYKVYSWCFSWFQKSVHNLIDTRENFIYYFFFLLVLRPNVGHGLLIHEFSRSHTMTHHSRQDSSGRTISSSQEFLPVNTHLQRQKSMPPGGFEPTISASIRPQTHALDGAATGAGFIYDYCS